MQVFTSRRRAVVHPPRFRNAKSDFYMRPTVIYGAARLSFIQNRSRRFERNFVSIRPRSDEAKLCKTLSSCILSLLLFLFPPSCPVVCPLPLSLPNHDNFSLETMKISALLQSFNSFEKFKGDFQFLLVQG